MIQVVNVPSSIRFLREVARPSPSKALDLSAWPQRIIYDSNCVAEHTRIHAIFQKGCAAGNGGSVHGASQVRQD